VRSHVKAATAGPTRRQGVRSRSRFTLAALATLVLCGLVALTASMASGAVSTEYVKSFGPDGTEGTVFERLKAIAVDEQNGNVYVLDQGFESPAVLYKFAADGTPLDWGGTAPYIDGNKVTGLAPSIRPGVAVDSTSHTVYVSEKQSVRAFEENGEAAEFAAGPGAGSDEIPGFGEVRGLAVDANGSIYVSDWVELSPSGTVKIFASTGEPLISFESPQPEALTVGPDGRLYVHRDNDVPAPSGAGGVEELIPNEFPVTPTTGYTAGQFFKSINSPDSADATGLDVDSVSGDLYILEVGTDSGANASASWVEKYDSNGNFVRYFGRPGEDGELESNSTGIAVFPDGEEFQFYVGAHDQDAGTSQVAIFGEVIEPGPPSVVSTSALDVTSTSATLRGEVNPNTFATAYRFEYGLGDCAASACTSVPLGGAAIGSGHHPIKVSQSIVGLQPGVTYHYRIVAENSEGVTEGPDRTLTTQLSGLGFELTDRRAWEMVSPPNKHGGSLFAGRRGIQAAADGNAIAYTSFGSIEAAPEGNRALEQSPVLSRREAAGWRSKDISLPQEKTTGLNFDIEYLPFAPDLSRAVVNPRDDSPLSPQASERTPYIRESTEPPTYTPLITGKEGFANVPPGTEFGGGEAGEPEVTGANPDLSHVVIASGVPLTEAPLSGGLGLSLFRWSAGEIDPVSELPPGEGGGIVPGLLGTRPGSTHNAVSEDGSRIFWVAGTTYYYSTASTTALYLRDTQAEESVRLDVAQPGASGAGDAHPVFQGASADGTVVFFTDSRQLTEDASPERRDLYRCEIPQGAAADGCATLTDISAPLAGSGESATVRDLAPAISEDGSRIYFVAKGVLDTDPNEEGATAVAGEPNLYLWEEEEGVRFIAALSPADHTTWGGLQKESSFGLEATSSAAGSPSGRYLTFMSERSLTGYDNREATSEEATEQAFRYDAASGELVCLSCNPTGASPRGALLLDKDGRDRYVDRLGLWIDRWVAATLPQANAGVATQTLYRPRSVLDNGRVFFNSFDSLVPADSNGEWDVYQFESSGVGECTPSSGGASVSRSEGGCVSLISSGTGKEEAAFMDASASGDDVFFLTPARLSVLDEDEDYDVYDARVDGVPARLEPDTECLGEACQPAALAPNDPTPASAGFRGEGNVKQSARKRCAKGKRLVRRKGRARCVARKHKRQSRAATKRRASR
jgi:hypothetical protein